ncbi:hypothetical protein MUN88_12700 [Gracilibacillus caseinilyticus]|uniref:Uncharacterized protein n=1 Tax=Gracilibacillus caseinilyticus TaxID=2932256 RepID=A0ABY4ERH6_9BACI|nr:hypothetical protein [Gracilibacillus caseinilyticus]UOQ46950.1 hypothetical protein MUN88_12700 [Gracilibacillus caseinilyticus]
MSEKKKVIYVKDLVIKADNVRIEPTRRHDPFFGPRSVEDDHHEVDDVVEEREEHHDHDDHKDHKDDNDRPPFSWI